MAASGGDVSALIVNYRAYDDLAACLGALIGQQPVSPVEIIVVDHDGIPDLAADIREQFPQVVFLSVDTNEGFAAGVNRAAARACGQYLLLVNPDTICSPSLARTLSTWLDEHPGVAAVGPRIFNEDGSLQPSARRFPDATTALAGRTTLATRLMPGNRLTRRNLNFSYEQAPLEVDWVTGACLLLRRSAFEEIGGMDTGFFLYWEDADLCRRLRSSGWKTAFVPLATAVHVGGRASRHARLRALVAFHRSAYRYYRKHGGAGAALASPLVWLGLWLRLGVKATALLVRGRP